MSQGSFRYSGGEVRWALSPEAAWVSGGAYTNGHYTQYQPGSTAPAPAGSAAGQSPGGGVRVEDGEGERYEGEEERALGEIGDAPPKG
jgi:hypothetical protein